MFILPDCIRHLRRPLSRMSSGLGLFTCGAFPPASFFFSAGCHPASSVSIAPHVMRHVLCPLYGILSPYARFLLRPLVWLSALLRRVLFFLFFPSISRYVVYRYLGSSMSCPPRFVLCSRVPRAVLSPPSVGSRHRRISRSYPRSSRFFFRVPSGEYSPPRPVRVQCGCISLPDLGGLPAVPLSFFLSSFFLFTCAASLP